MSDLVTWLRAQLDADEQVAQKAGGAAWAADISRAVHVDASWIAANRGGRSLGYVATVEREGDRQHIALWDPARVLAEIDAKQRIIDEYFITKHDDGKFEYEAAIFPLLALPYADRPGYRDEWRPASGHPDE